MSQHIVELTDKTGYVLSSSLFLRERESELLKDAYTFWIMILSKYSKKIVPIYIPMKNVGSSNFPAHLLVLGITQLKNVY